MTKVQLLGSWCLDDGQGQIIKDRSSYCNHGQLGTLHVESTLPAWISGRSPSTLALRFNGENFVKIPNQAAYEAQSTVTVEVWVRSDNPESPYSYIVSKGADRCVAASYGLYTGENILSTEKNIELFFYVYQGPDAKFILSPNAGSSVWDGQWHHVAGTFDGNTVRLYVDGKQAGNGTILASPLSIAYDLPARDLYIGTYVGDSRICQLGFTGDIAEVRIWDSALTLEEITQRVQGVELI